MSIRSLLPIRRDGNAARFEPHPFATLQREIDRLFDDFTRGFPSFGVATTDLAPTMDVSETDKEIEITAELPGLEEKDVQVNVADNVLTIRGEKKAEKEEKDKNYHFSERSYGSFQRAFELPASVDRNKIAADFSKGVLTLTLPKTAEAQTQAKKIEVKSS